MLLACASDVNGKDCFVSTRYDSYLIGTCLPEYMSISLVKSRCTRDPVHVGPGDVYRSRRGILTKPWKKLQIREIESLTL